MPDKLSREPDASGCSLPVGTTKKTYIWLVFFGGGGAFVMWITLLGGFPRTAVTFLTQGVIYNDNNYYRNACYPTYRNHTELPASDRVLSKRLVGRMGNQLFQFASTYGLARDNKMVPMLVDYKELLACFPRINVALSDGHPEKIYKNQWDGDAMKYRKTLSDLFSKDTNIFLSGFLQSWRYFHHRAEELRSQLKFSAQIQERVDTFLHSGLKMGRMLEKTLSISNSTSNKTIPLVGIHVRRGDFVRDDKLKLGYKSTDKGYIGKAIEHFEKMYSHVVFVVASDDITWTKQNIVPDKQTILFSPFSTVNEDLCLLASCDHTIMGTGTFSWWGAWLANGHTVYPANFPELNTWLGKQYTKEDYYLPSWRRL